MPCSCLYVVAVVIVAVSFAKLVRRYAKLDKLHSRPVFITGCDSGFGRLLATRLDKKGIPVYAGCLLESSVRAPSRLKAVQIDVTDTQSVKAAAACVKTDLDGKALWGIVNNAGIPGPTVPFLWTTRDDCQRTMDVNILGVYDVTLAFLPLIIKGGEGRVVNIASVFGRVGISASGYVLSKHAVEGFSDGLSYELDRYNITVHTLEPGYFRTNLTDGISARKSVTRCWERLSPETKQQFGGEPYKEELSNYVQMALRDNSSPKIEMVVDAYEHALFGKYPENRYHVGNDSSYFFIPLSVLPFEAQMRIMITIQKLTGQEPPQPKDVS